MFTCTRGKRHCNHHAAAACNSMFQLIQFLRCDYISCFPVCRLITHLFILLAFVGLTYKIGVNYGTIYHGDSASYSPEKSGLVTEPSVTNLIPRAASAVFAADAGAVGSLASTTSPLVTTDPGIAPVETSTSS